MDPYSAETLRFVGNRATLRTCRRICLDIGANGPASPAAIARRLSADPSNVLARITRMHQAGWVDLRNGIASLALSADPFPKDL